MGNALSIREGFPWLSLPAGSHPGSQLLARRRERLYLDAHSGEPRATVEDDVSTGIALFYIRHADELILPD